MADFDYDKAVVVFVVYTWELLSAITTFEEESFSFVSFEIYVSLVIFIEEASIKRSFVTSNANVGAF